MFSRRAGPPKGKEDLPKGDYNKLVENIIENRESTSEIEPDGLEEAQSTSTLPSPTKLVALTTYNAQSNRVGINREITDSVQAALELFLPNCYISCDLLEIWNQSDIEITPDESGQFLMYGKSDTYHKLYVCSNKFDMGTKFIFLNSKLIGSETKYYVISPYYTDNKVHIPSNKILCASVEITEAVTETPRAVAKVLRQIQRGDNGLHSDIFTWIIEGRDELGISGRSICII
ncbi:hypothetical protein LOD99_6121 [Oopsacas minuta]|uniref:Uncharacterized protein n=1 Tax=Oopsacas minuta TaxID=111878 RepID=A0AAV7JN27_9METZ|nr:hypothetical protein LOD99_6121 [Oopsacas minuta]